jgi:UDP-2-acetamido-3-amino-2,3-dideoxy-glucuronate N-acetyltransferase
MTRDVFVHERGICESSHVGRGTRIWAFAHVLPGARIGVDCNICDHVFIENDVVVGDRVTIKSGVQLWDGVRIEDDVFVGPNVTFTNDPFPRSKAPPKRFLTTILKEGASIGANGTLLPGVTIGQNAMVGAGAVVTKSVPPHAIVAGNPASITGYVSTDRAAGRKAVAPRGTLRMGPHRAKVPGVTLHKLPLINDLRGDLCFGEFAKIIPFSPRRFFLVFNVPNKEVRGAHAHRRCHQFMVCTKGSVSVVVDDGNVREELTLDSPDLGLHIPPMIWGIQHRYSPDVALLVFASRVYEPHDYIRDYDQYLHLKKGKRT